MGLDVWAPAAGRRWVPPGSVGRGAKGGSADGALPRRPGGNAVEPTYFASLSPPGDPRDKGPVGVFQGMFGQRGVAGVRNRDCAGVSPDTLEDAAERRSPDAIVGPVGGRGRSAMGSLALAAALGWSPVVLVGCSSVCSKVEAARVDFDAAPAAKGWDVALRLPYDALDRLIAPQLRALPRARLPLPEVAGFSLGTVEAMVESVRVRPASAGKVGFALRVSLRADGKRLLVFELKGEVPPRVDTQRGAIVVELGQAQIAGLEVQLAGGGARELTEWLWTQLPAAAKGVLPKAQLQQLVEQWAGQLSSELAPELASRIPALFRSVATLEFDLGDLPVGDLQVASAGDALELRIHTGLAVGSVADLPRGAAPGLPADGIQLRLSGATLAGMANEAIRSGEIPSRYDREGNPDPKGEFTARLRWSAGARPLKAELFGDGSGGNKGDCAHLELGATPVIQVRDTHLELSTNDAKLEKVHAGTPRVRSAIFFSGVGRRSFSLVEELANSADFEVGEQTLRARVVQAKMATHGLDLALRLDAAARG